MRPSDGADFHSRRDKLEALERQLDHFKQRVRELEEENTYFKRLLKKRGYDVDKLDRDFDPTAVADRDPNVPRD